MRQIYSQHEPCDVDFGERLFALVSYMTLANHIAGACLARTQRAAVNQTS